MPSLASLQQGFAEAILTDDLPVPRGLRVPEGSALCDRFDVYRANVAVTLTEALRSSFPVVSSLVGDDFFSAMAASFASTALPRSPVLLAYGREFPAFIAAFEPARLLPYLPEVAQLEWLWLESYHSAEAEPLALSNLGCVRPDQVPQLRLTLHPSVRFTRFSHPALSVWRFHQQAGEPAELELAETTEGVLLVRPHTTVEVLPASEGMTVFLQELREGRSIEWGASVALDVEPMLDVASVLPLLFEVGTFSALLLPDEARASPGESSDDVP